MQLFFRNASPWYLVSMMSQPVADIQRRVDDTQTWRLLATRAIFFNAT